MIIIIVFTIFVLYLFHELYWKRRNLPPGPTPLPLIGNLHTISRLSPGYEAHLNWRKEYGPVYTFWLGNLPIVAVSDYETIKQSFIKEGDAYSGRFKLPHFTTEFRGGHYGIADIDGDYWREQRRFVLTAFRDFGMGRNLMEQKIMDEVDAMIGRILAGGKEIDMRREFDMGVGSIINSLLFGYHFREDNCSEFYELKGCLTEQFRACGNPIFMLLIQFPKLRGLPVFRDVWKKVFDARDALHGFYKQQIKEKREKIDFNLEDREDYVEYFLKEQHKRRNEIDFDGFSDLQLVNVLSDLWSAGLETTSTTLSWCLIYILNHPHVQIRIHEELDKVIESDRRIILTDRNSLPYMNATICEVQRLSNLLPQNLVHRTTEDVVVGGYQLEEGTAVMPQIACVLYDGKMFPEPYSFKPERFLNSDGSFRKFEEFVPFSIGKRQCLGEGLAKNELFLFLSNIMQRFEVQCDTVPSMEKVVAFTVQPRDFTCTLVERIK